MPKPSGSNPTAQTTTVVPTEDRLALAESFIELVSERWGYVTGRKLKLKEMNEDTNVAAAAKKARETSKAVTEGIEKLIKSPTQDHAKVVTTKREDLKDQRKALKEARAPFNEKISELQSAIKYCDSVAIPDSLKELGKPVVPRFSLTDYMKKAVEQTKKKK